MSCTFTSRSKNLDKKIHVNWKSWDCWKTKLWFLSYFIKLKPGHSRFFVFVGYRNGNLELCNSTFLFWWMQYLVSEASMKFTHFLTLWLPFRATLKWSIRQTSPWCLVSLCGEQLEWCFFSNSLFSTGHVETQFRGFLFAWSLADFPSLFLVDFWPAYSWIWSW